MRKKLIKYGLLIGLAFALTWWMCDLDVKNLFRVPYSTALYDRQGKLLGARIASDGQWRFPLSDSLPHIYKEAVEQFEDKRFPYHLGVDPIAIVRAALTDIKARHVKEGGSTITMQVIRLAGKNPPRTFLQKCKEAVNAVRLEIGASKDKIFRMYASYAPFGGNTVGIEAACWRYYGHSPAHMSTAEAATLAVLPNAPSLIFPGKSSKALLNKRNRLLADMWKEGIIDSLSYRLATEEPLPGAPKPLPDLAPHALQLGAQSYAGTRMHSTLDVHHQKLLNEIIASHYRQLSRNGVYNAAALICDVHTGQVVAYTGNTPCHANHSSYVDIIQCARSSGSTLKPFMYAAMQQEGDILPHSLVPDIPTFIAGFHPKNYSRDYMGAVPADEALSMSLNVPAVRLLRNYGIGRFKDLLQQCGFTTVSRSPANYGLSLILGGAEITLWDLANAYLGMAQQVDFKGFVPDSVACMHLFNGKIQHRSFPLNPGACWLITQALQEVKRPIDEAGWQYFNGAPIAWKTGTSFGYRDAWAVGYNPDYLVAVWVGNADGEGRPGVIGAEAAAPIMFDVFSHLHSQHAAFPFPRNFLKKVVVCHQSGFLAGIDCPDKDTIWAAAGGLGAQVCQYHHKIWLTQDESHRISRDCNHGNGAEHTWFTLPATEAYYYQKHHVDYHPLPPLSKGCGGNEIDNAPFALIYPSNFQQIVQTRDANGKPGPVVFKVAHRDPSAKVYWEANGKYLGTTSGLDELPVQLSPGKYNLHVVDENGYEVDQRFEVVK